MERRRSAGYRSIWGNASATYPVTASTTACARVTAGIAECTSIQLPVCFTAGHGTTTSAGSAFNCSNTSRVVSLSHFDVTTTWAAQAKTGTLIRRHSIPASRTARSSTRSHGRGPRRSGDDRSAFQIAVSNSSSGPWNFIGPDGTSGTTYSCGSHGCTDSAGQLFLADRQIFPLSCHFGDESRRRPSPQVTSVIVNWSP